MSSSLYPLTFDPIFKERIWGGTKLNTYLNKSVTSDSIGESWEISTVKNSISIINNGPFKGMSLNDLIAQFPQAILGTKVYEQFGKQFPLLFKFIDAKEDLSIQLHPNDQLAMKRHNSFGKTEMWYVMQADENARLIIGFKEKSSPEEYLKHLQDKTLLTILDSNKVIQGDAFFLETGTIHAIGGGIVVAEIQQTSDITYRLYDYDRVDSNGKRRKLHVDLALDAINYNKVNSKKDYKKQKNVSNEIVDCRYFTTNFISLDGDMKICKDPLSFTVFMCVEGSFEIVYDGVIYQYKMGDTLLIPACMSEFVLYGKASVLEIYIS
jgi:mannose-6-phosphate isomerase